VASSQMAPSRQRSATSLMPHGLRRRRPAVSLKFQGDHGRGTTIRIIAAAGHIGIQKDGLLRGMPRVDIGTWMMERVSDSDTIAGALH
jgi:hypothetical protein